MQNASTLPIESEFKVVLSQAQYELLCTRWDPPQQVLKQDNLFFTSPSLVKARLALRLRHENKRYILTCKGPSRLQGQAILRMELECELPASIAEQLQFEPTLITGLDNPVAELLKKSKVQNDLQPWMRFTNLRKRYAISLDHCDFIIELDKTRFAHHIEDYELELEFSPRSEDATKGLHAELKKTLQQLNVPMQMQTKGKLGRAIAAQRGT